ncbi:MAG: hypothetical protein IJ552_02555 [Prevotella sp.]|nr:hypothetical protein [Prevotella sp.]
MSPNIQFGSSLSQFGCRIECWVTNNGPQTAEDPSGGYLVKYELILNEDGLPPDDFYGTYSGSDPTPASLEVSPKSATSKIVTFTPTTANAKYARFVLVKDGEELTISSTALTVGSGNGQTSSERPKRGLYVYNNGGLSDDDLSVTVTLDEGTFEDYQLVAYFSDEVPELVGTIITKEPATLDEKQIFSFNYPTQTIDKYISWNTNSTTIDLASLINSDLPTLTNSSTKGYIGWSVYDGPYGSSNLVNIQGNHYNPSAAPAWAMTFNSNDTKNSFSISDGQISGSWGGYTNVTVYAPGTQKFEDYKNYVVVAEVSDVSSEKIRVRYIFHFNADGLPPYELVNETAITDTKKAVPVTDYEAASQVFDVSEALVSGAKYARVYVAKYGNPIDESANLTVTYDGAALTQCAAGNVKYGWYLSEAGGINPAKLSITGLDAAEMLKYELVIVSADEELSGTKEPAWDKKTVIYLQKDIRNRVLADSEKQNLVLNFQDNILTTQLGGAQVSDFSKSLYAKWYILDPTDNKVAIGPASGGNTVWRFDMRNYSVEQWTLDGREYKYFTDNDTRTKTAIEDANGWAAQVAKVGQLFVQENGTKHTSDYIGYKIVFEFCDEYDTSTGAEPAYKLKYTTIIVDPTAFTGTLSDAGVADGKIQEVTRSAASVDIDLETGAYAHSKLSGKDLKYARFYLADAEGHLVNPDGKLEVKYDGATTNVTACNNAEEGYYIYLGGSPIEALDKSKVSVQLKAPKTYKLYKVVGVFSTEMTEMMPDDGNTPLTREPDWELNYSWNFTYPAPTTKEYARTMEWRRQEMKADASTTNIDTDWDTSWEELSLGQCVKWYVENESGVKQPLAYGDSRQTSTWTIAAHDPFAVSDNVATLVGTHAVTEGKWNNNWGKPAIYAPAGVDFETVKNYKIICEVAAENSTTATPNAKYTITMFKSYLGELKETGTTDSEIMMVNNISTSETVPLSNALTGCTGAKYARVWLTTPDGTRIDPTGILTVTGMTAYTTEGDKNVNFGYYISDESGISLSDATLTAEAGTFDKYQVHVALSTDLPGTSEPDYDYEYAFHFKYDVKTKYKTVLYDEASRQCTPHLLGNWQELAVDCNEGRTNLAANLYVRWYLEDKNTGNPIAMESLTSTQPYTNLGGTTGYYRYGFDSSQFANKGDGTAYNPTITLPSSVTDYKNVRVVCVVTTKTDTWNEPWTADPEEMQVKYVYDLRTTSDLDPATYPFVHYQGEGYRYVAEQGLTDMANARDYTKVSGTTVTTQYTWNSSTNTYESADKDIRQNVHTVDYYYYLNLNEGDEEELLLPLQFYTGGGNDTEPRAYFRWYDFNTDQKSDNLVAIGDKLVERTWGHVALPFGDHPCSGRVGVKFKAPTGFTSLTESDEILIACDVSRYLDGMDDSFTYLVHEPTISERYLFHILPASILAANTKAKAESLSAVETQLQTKSATELPSILEYSGRIVVSTDNGTGKFSLRTKIRDLNHYYVYDASDNIVAADYMQWYAYYKDAANTWWKLKINMGGRSGQRQANYTLSDLNTGTWEKLSGEGTTPPTISVDDRVTMIATVGNTAAGEGKELPIIWGELEIIDAAPMTLGNEPEDRTTGYMNAEYNHANTLDFNDFFLIGKKKPENSFENYAKIPIEWPNAQYGFCYPQLYGLCATNKFSTDWGVYGVSPLHGDYTLLKTMNIEGISQDENRDNQSILCQWWDTTTLFDITHERASNKAFGDTEDYGAFLYVDAADEARTIAQLEFDAALCPNARLYYTAYVADITNGATKPQLRFRVSVEDNGERVPVVSFVTGDIQEEVGGTIAEGQWYQVYGYTTIPAEMENYLNGTKQHFYVEIDNYCDNTEGADYCVDQISFFTQSAIVQVKQLGSPCDEGSGVEVKVVAPADKLLSSLGGKNTGTKKVFYRLFKKHDDMNASLQDKEEEEVYAPGVYSDDDPESTLRYATVIVDTNYDEALLPTGQLPEGQKRGYYKGDDGVIYYQFDDRFFPLEVNSTYFVSFYTMGATEVVGFNGWGNPYSGSVCSTYSNYIMPKVLRIDLESGGEKSDGTIPLGCGVDDAEKTFDITVQYPVEDGYVPYTNVTFDFYQGSKAEFKAIKSGDLYLEKALEHFRQKYPDYKYTDGDLPTGYNEIYTEAMHNLIVEYMGTNAGKLTLLATTQFYHHFYASEEGEKKFAAIPVNREVEGERYICSPLEFVFDVQGNAGAPVMEIGFGDVTYPTGYDKRVVRVGIEQLNKMKTEDYKLHIPVSRYQNKGNVLNGRKLSFSGNGLTFSASELKISDTNDPTVSVGTKVADIFDPDGEANAYVSTNRMYVPLDFSDCKVEFHEGYFYEVSTSYMDEDDDPSNPCLGDLFIVFKVVPEFVTWDAKEIGSSELFSGNWYDDKNWKRSGRTELYKGEVTTAPTADNHATAGHPNGYKNNEEINSLLTTSPGFVPMKFTYVTLLGNNHSPSMINENYGGKVAGTPQTGGDLISPTNDLASDTSPSVGSSAYLDDKFIRYDMLVRYGTHANGGEGCFGHQTMSNSGGSWGWNTFDPASFTENAKVYDVEKFYGNICKEIYFKPGAELRLQQRLKYEKAWVEKELEPGKWYLMSTPLKSTYAGDMYVPTSMTDVTDDTSVKGRQVTEAFQPITFSTPTYSRTKYPIYQRAWGLQNTKVYTKTDDIRKPYYSADLKFPTLTSNLVEWSHTFNDVQVPYNNYSGFAIRAHKKSQTDNALIRLPKADTEYDYYQWDGSKPVSGAIAKQAVDKDNAGRFVFDYESGDLEQWTISLSNLQAQGIDEEGYNYYLVGNPFMASIDMGKFFGYEDNGTYYSYNPKLDPVYYTYEAGVLQAVNATTAAGIIRPMQAFIVKCKANDKPENIIFNRWAITDGNYTAPTLYVPENGSGNNGARQFNISLRADNNRGGSTVSVVIDEESSVGYADSEDAMTLFDSNLSDVPTVFTMANGRALSIDKRPALDVVPFGVACASSDEAVTMTIEGTDALEGSLYVIDAVTKESIEVGDGSTFTVQPNDYGRYFLSFKGNLTGIEKNDVQKGIVVSVRGKEVTVTSSDDIKLVRALSLNGATMYQDGACGTSTTFTLAGGVYIIRVKNMAGEQQIVKIVVK